MSKIQLLTKMIRNIEDDLEYGTIRTLNKIDDEESRLIEENAKLRKGIEAVRALIDESSGVYGLHLNCDESPWDELEEGGRYEDWLFDFNAAEGLINHE